MQIAHAERPERARRRTAQQGRRFGGVGDALQDGQQFGAVPGERISRGQHGMQQCTQSFHGGMVGGAGLRFEQPRRADIAFRQQRRDFGLCGARDEFVVAMQVVKMLECACDAGKRGVRAYQRHDAVVQQREPLRPSGQ